MIRDHFLHVLDHLFTSTVEKAGFKVIRPVMKGGDLIQAEIIRSLEQADLVLCDISQHNPNVFFELGVRTALDRPVALVRDSLTDRLPFDTGILNTYKYSAELTPWTITRELSLLSEHVEQSYEGPQQRNALWRYFGLTQRAQPNESEQDPVNAKLDLLLTQMTVRREGLGQIHVADTEWKLISGWLFDQVITADLQFLSMSRTGRTIYLNLGDSEPVDRAAIAALKRFAKEYGYILDVAIGHDNVAADNKRAARRTTPERGGAN